MIFKKLTAALMLAGAFVSSAATATPFTIDASSLRPAITSPSATDGITALIQELTLFWEATSIFTDDNGTAGLNFGDSVLDTGDGFITALEFGSSVNRLLAENNEGFNSSWGLGFSYDNLVGTVAGVSPTGNVFANYTSGTISIFAIDGFGVNTGELLELTVVGSDGDFGILELFAKVSSVSPDIFFANGTTDFSDLPILSINARIDFNLDGEAPSQVGNTNVYSRTSNLDGSGAFVVPEPGVIALLGLGMIGIAAVRRNKKVV